MSELLKNIIEDKKLDEAAQQHMLHEYYVADADDRGFPCETSDIKEQCKSDFKAGALWMKNELQDVFKIETDWEQRRYETAKAAMVGILSAPVIEGVDPNPSIADAAKRSVMLADALIEELKKRQVKS